MNRFNELLCHITVMHIFGWLDSADFGLVNCAGLAGEISVEQELLLESFLSENL